MSELRLAAAPPRSEGLRLLRSRIADVVPGWQALAEDVLGADARIDLVGSEPNGGTVLVLVGEAGQDLELIGRGLAQHAWVTPRVADWLQLAPDLPLRAEAGVRVVLLCPAFRPEAVAALGAMQQPCPLLLGTLRFLRNAAGVEPLIEPLERVAAPTETQDVRRLVAIAPFRTGLTDDDLALSSEEHAEFE
ncbi:MAG: hypothetical protein OEM49_03095 [Myxococcales bacterium]|nr:hypothetical protein [Myxococcales bacterium]MDH5307674.1 hypothetical protein [Myxococcales bacterium]MDH5565908.1 hypothetical protein [Myxococcales bacterium]